MTMKEAVSMLWTTKLMEAEKILEKFKKKDPSCALHFAEAAFVKVSKQK